MDATTKEIHEHYDRGNDFFNAFLGPRMVRRSLPARRRCPPRRPAARRCTPFRAGTHAEPPACRPRKIYTSAYYHGTDQSLEQAQDNKLNLLCEKMHLFKPGMRHLDIGCGWGTLVRWSAKEF